MSHNKRVALGFFLAPIIPCIALSLYAFAALGFHNAITPLFVLPYYLLACYMVISIVAMPLYLLLKRLFRITLVTCLTCGFAIGALVSLIPFTLQYYGVWPMFDSYQIGGTDIIVNRHFTYAGVVHNFQNSAQTGMFGAAVAFSFWFFGMRGSIEAQANLSAKAP